MRGGAVTTVLTVLVVVTMIGVGRPAAAQTTAAPGIPVAPGVLFVSGQASGGETSTRGGGVEWLRPMSPSATLDLGGFMGSSAAGWFSYGRLGTIARVGQSTLSGAMDLGGGRESTMTFSYLRARGEVGVPLPTSRSMVLGEVEHIRIAGNVVTAVRAGGAFVITSRFSARISGHVYAVGGEISPATSLRGDYASERWRVFGGVFVSPRPQLTGTSIEVSPALYAKRSAFAGVEMAVGVQNLNCALNISELPRGQVATLLLSLRVPLR
jgi:hypothetical protein